MAMIPLSTALRTVAWASVLGAGVACQSERPPPPSAQGVSGGGKTHNDAGGAFSDMGGSGGAESVGGSQAGGAAGQPGSVIGSTGSGGITEPAACSSDIAFQAVSSAFVEPTPKALALRLNELTFDGAPISFVLQGEAPDQTLQASYTVDEDGYQVFPGALIPPETPAWLQDNDFGSVAPQEEGWLLVTTEEGPLELPLRNIRVTASTESDCTRGLAVVTGVAPAEQADVWEELVEPTAEDAEDGERGGADMTIRALFAIELVEFHDRGATP